MSYNAIATKSPKLDAEPRLNCIKIVFGHYKSNMYRTDNVNSVYESTQTELWNQRLRDYQAYLLLKKNRYLSKRGLFKPLCDYTAGDEFSLDAYTVDQINALFAILCMNPRCDFETTRANMHRLIPDASLLRFLHHENN